MGMREESMKIVQAVRPGRLVMLLLVALLAGLLREWIGSDERLLFPRPLPAFTTTAPAR